jgi:hypothetical protein
MSDETASEKFIRIPLSEALGVPFVARQRLQLYLPNRDKAGKPIPDIDVWIQAAEALMTDLNGGATTLKVKGMWRCKTGKILMEDTALIYSFIHYPEHFLERMKKLVEFVREFGRETNQEELLVEFNNQACFVTNFVKG